MEEQSVSGLFLEDIEANIAFFQLFGFAAAIVIVLIGAVLAARAGAMLSEARLLYWRMDEIEKSVSARLHRGERWPGLRKTAPRRKAAHTRQRGRSRAVV